MTDDFLTVIATAADDFHRLSHEAAELVGRGDLDAACERLRAAVQALRDGLARAFVAVDQLEAHLVAQIGDYTPHSEN